MSPIFLPDDINDERIVTYISLHELQVLSEE
jgi:hypothetical protein